jgi:aspartate 1-decarboxylase
MLSFLSSKIHRATVTGARLDYCGSITIAYELLLAAGMYPNEKVHVNNLSNAAHWETYVIAGDPGVICLNGAPARLFYPGDEVVIMSFTLLERSQICKHEPTIVFVDKNNKVLTK